MIQIYTGNGKGKTTAALGLIVRALGSGKKVCLLQFMKNNSSSEIKFLTGQRNLDILQFGTEKFVDPHNLAADDLEEAGKAINRTFEIIESNTYDLLVLDEINVAVNWGLISLNDQLKIFNYQSSIEIVMTGRGADRSVIERADLVTEMKEVKHYFSKGVKARKGIEF